MDNGWEQKREEIKRLKAERALQVLKEVRYRAICKRIEENPEITSFAVARSSGLSNEQGLFKFLKRHFNTTYSEIRYEVLIRKLSELNGNGKPDSLIEKWLE